MSRKSALGMLTWSGRGGAAKTVSALEKPAHTTDKEKREKLRAMMIDAHHQEFAHRTREFSRVELTKGRSVVSKSFGATLRFYRKQVGYSQEELASICGLDRTYPSLLERGLRAPTIGVMTALALALRLAPVELYCTFLDTLRDRAAHAGAKATKRPVPAEAPQLNS